MGIARLHEKNTFGTQEYICKSEHTSTYYCESHTHDFYEFVVVLSKKSVHYINENKYHLNVGDVFFLQPGETHRFERPLQNPATFLTLGLKGKTFDKYVNIWGNALKNSFNFKNTGVITLSADEFSKINDIYNQFKLEKNERKDLLLVNNLFCILINRCNFNHSSISHTALDYVLNAMNTPENIAEGIPAMTRISGLSSRQLTRVLKKKYNTTPYEYITELRMNYAANLLLHTDMSITYISYEVGYCNSNNFTIRFKKKFGMTPTQYRQKLSSQPI